MSDRHRRVREDILLHPLLSPREKELLRLLAIAVALANDPRILLADEPTGELDSENATVVFDNLKMASRDRGKTVLLVSHDAHAAKIADATMDMEDGRLLSFSP